MSKFAAALNARNGSTTAEVALEPYASSRPIDVVHPEPAESEEYPVVRRVGRPAGKRSDGANTQVTGYVPAQLYYDVRIKLLERKMRNRKANTDFSDLMREWMERWLAEQS